MEEESTATEEGGLGAVGMDVDEGAGSGAEDGVVTDGVSAASEGGEQGQPETQAQAQTQTQTEAETETETETETQTQVSEQDHEDVAKAEKSGNEADMLVEKKVEDETSDEAAAVEGKEEGTLEEKTEEAEEGKAIGEGEEDAGAEAVAGGAVGKKRAREEDEEAGSGEGADASNPSSGILSSSSSPDPALKRPKVESSPTGEVHKVRGGVIATPLQAQEIGQRLPPGQALVPAVEVSASKQFTPAYGKRQHKPKTPVFPGNAEDGLSGRRRSHVTSEDMQKSGQFGSVPVNVWRKKARELLVTLNSKDFAILFSVPVDPVVLGIPTYFNVIKNPMDLGTVKSKLSTNLARTKYRTFDSFLNDVRQTFQNAITFNGPQHEVGALATEFLSLVEKEIADFDKIHNTAFSKLTPPLPVTPSTPMAVDDAIVEVPAEVPDAGVVRKSNRRSSGPSSRQSTASSSIGNVIQELETARSQVETDLGKLLEFKRAVSTKLCDSMRLDFHEGELRKALNIITEDLIGARSGSMPPDRGQLLSPSTPTSAASGGSSARRGSRPPGSASSATSGGSATTSRSQPSSRPASTSSHGGPGGPAHRKSNKTSKGSSTPASSSSNTSGNSGAKRTGSSSTPSSRPKSSSSSHHRGDVKEMDPIEKRRLSYNIDKLPSEHLSEVLNIITQNSKINVDEDDDEVVVDIDKLDKFTLRKLDEYVQQCMSQRRKSQGTTRKPPPKKPAPSSTAARAGNSAGSANTGLSASGGDSEYGLLPPIPENEGKAGSSGAAVSKSSTSTTAATSTSGASASGTPASSQPAAATSSTGGTPASQASASGATKTGTPASASAPPPKPSSTWNGEIESTSSESSSGEDESSDSESDPQGL